MNDAEKQIRRAAGPPLGRGKPPEDEEAPPLVPLWRRQLPLLLLVAFALIVALATSGLEAMREILRPVFWEHPFYLNPFITFTLLIYVGLGLVMLTGTGDQGWPWYILLIGIWVFVIAFEYSIVQWFAIQAGALFGGSHINPVQFTAITVAVGAAILLHVNQLNRRLYNGLTQRGVDTEELQNIEQEAGHQARAIVVQLVGLLFAATLILWLADLIVGSTGLGLNVLGILAGLLVMSVLLAYSYAVLKKGPITTEHAAAASRGVTPPGHRPDGPPGIHTTGHGPRHAPVTPREDIGAARNGPRDNDWDETASEDRWIRRD